LQNTRPKGQRVGRIAPSDVGKVGRKPPSFGGVEKPNARHTTCRQESFLAARMDKVWRTGQALTEKITVRNLPPQMF